jgi:hypothetical protein
MSTCLPKPAAAARAPGLGSFGVFSMSGRGSGSGPPPPGGSYQAGPGLGDVIMHATSALGVRRARNATNAPSGSTTCFPGAALTCDAARHRRS